MKKWFRLACWLLVIFGVSPVQSQSSLPDLYATDSIQELEIRFAEDNWRFVLDSLRYNGDEMLEGDLTLNGQSYPGVGVRIRRSRAFKPGDKRNSLHIQLNFTDAGQNYQGYTALKLSSALRDPSLVREVLGYEIARDYMPAPKANYAKVLVNDEYYGLLVNIEAVDSPKFLDRYFVNAQGALYLSDPPRDEADIPQPCVGGVYSGLIYDNTMACYEAFFRIIKGSGYGPVRSLADALETDVTNIGNDLDVDRTLWMLAFNNVLVNLSSYTGQNSPNYLLYVPAGAPATPMVWDLNLAFGSFKNTGMGSDLKLRELIELDPLLHADSRAKPLINKLLADEMNRKVYLSHVRTILNDWLVNGVAAQRARELQELIKIPLLTDRNRYYNSDEFDVSLEKTIGKLSKIPGLNTFLEDRSSWLKKTEEMLVNPPDIGRITYKEREQFSRDRVEAFHIQVPLDRYTKRVRIVYRFDEDGPFQTANLVDDGSQYDEEAGDQIFGIILNPPSGKKNLEFYLLAENARAVSFSPVHYVAEMHSVSLDELN